MGMERYRTIRLEMPGAEPLPFWGGAVDSDTEDLAAWLRDVSGDGVSDEPFDSSIDASWLGAAPTGEGEERSGDSGSASGSG